MLLEAGQEHPSPEIRDDLEVELTGCSSNGVRIGRTRQVGGGLNLWGGQLSLPQTREIAGGNSWPIEYAELFGHAQKAVAKFGSNIELAPDLPASAHKGLQSARTFGFDTVATGWLQNPKLDGVFWDRLTSSPLIHIEKDVFVHSIICDPDGIIRGVHGIRPDGQRISIHCNCVIIAAGTIETVRLLLQPSVHKLSQPWHNLEWLGCGYNDHLDSNVAEVIPNDTKILNDIFDPFLYRGYKHTIKLYNRIQLQSDLDISTASMLTMPGNIRNSLAEFRMLATALTPRSGKLVSLKSLGKTAMASCYEIGPLAWRYLKHKRIGSTFKGAANLRVIAEQPIRKHSRITLSKHQRDRFGIAKASLHWIKGEEESAAFSQTAKNLKSWIEGSGLGRVTIDPKLEHDPEGFVDSADDGLHHAGGTLMSERPSQGVVDRNLQVHETRGLYCCAASVFPRMGFGNPTLLAMALGRRLAEHIIQEYQTNP